MLTLPEACATGSTGGSPRKTGGTSIPIYPFHCDACGAEFEISRKISAMRDPAACPACGEDARRVFTGVALTGQAEDPSKARTSKPKPGGWSHMGHSHGPGTGAHSHGLWEQPSTPAPKPPEK